MQKTKLRILFESIFSNIQPLLSDSWKKRSLLILSLLFGFYLTNSFISFLLDKSINTIVLSVLILILMEFSIRSILFSNYSKLTLSVLLINNFRIGSTYALILEAFKLGS